MDSLLSNEKCEQTKLPEQLILPPKKRIAREDGPTVRVPVIDLRGGPHCHVADRDKLIGEILRAGKEFGFFLVVNHGVSEQVMVDMMGLAEEFFNMPNVDKATYYTEDITKTNRLTSRTVYGKDVPRFSHDCLRLACYPIRETINDWPDKPTNFREVLANFIIETKDLSVMLLSLICEGLGLKEGYFEGKFSSGRVFMNAVYDPPCLEQDLTLGLPPDFDRNLIHLLLQGNVSNLQIMHHGKWIGVQLIPNAFLINLGHVINITRTGVLESIEHRANTNSGTPWTSMAVFIMPALETFISPEKETVNEENFLRICTDLSAKRVVDVKEAFKING